MRERERKLLMGAAAIAVLGTAYESLPHYVPRAFTTPWGIVYLEDNPSETVKRHEECHWQKVQEVGAAAFFTEYFLLGGAEAEEKRCGESDHPVADIWWGK